MTDLEKRILDTQETHRIPLILNGEQVVAVGENDRKAKAGPDRDQ